MWPVKKPVPAITTKTVTLWLLLALSGTAAFALQTQASELLPEPPDGHPPLTITPPLVAMEGINSTIEITVNAPLAPLPPFLELRSASGVLIIGELMESGPATAFTFIAREADSPYSVMLAGRHEESILVSLRIIPGWLTLLPPLISILLALLFRQIVPALLAGVWVGAWIIHGGPLIGILRTMDRYIVGAASDADHVAIIIFSLLLGGMVGLISRSGGTIGLVEALTPLATSSRRGQLVTWLLGLLVFFDDYANTLLVGNTMRPVTDRLKISREKLAYMVDSTAAPVASVALISTWIGYEVSLISDALHEVGSSLDAYAVFLQSLLYRFYPFLALFFGLLIASSLRDFGPMAHAEHRAARGCVLADNAVPLSDFDNRKLDPPADKPRRWINAVLPVLVVLLVTFWGLWATGRASLTADGSPAGSLLLAELGFRDLGTIFGAGNSFHSLLWASLAGCLTAAALPLFQRILTLGEALAAWSEGIKSMTLAFVILVLAWSISAVCSDLNTSGFMVDLLADNLDPRYLSTLVFLIAAGTSFATGTSWGTMGILIPLAVPTAFGLAQTAGFDPASSHQILLGAISAVLAGAIFGDHCSPISDTTVLSSIASGCDHIDHVRTQMPYALTVAVVATFLGYLPSGFGVNPLLCMLVASATLLGILRLAGRPQTA